MKKPVLCLLGFHDWEVVKSTINNKTLLFIHKMICLKCSKLGIYYSHDKAKSKNNISWLTTCSIIKKFNERRYK